MAQCKYCKRDVPKFRTDRRSKHGSVLCIDATGRQWKSGKCPSCRYGRETKLVSIYEHLRARLSVDPIDQDLLASYRWLIRPHRNTYYAHRHVYSKVTQKTSHKRFHRILMARIIGRELRPDEIVDHIDGDGLNNRRSNLRVCTVAENNRNQVNARRKSNKKYRGVYLYKAKFKRHPWEARIGFENRVRSLGYYATPLEAALVYDEAAKRLHGAFATLNFPNEVSQTKET